MTDELRSPFRGFRRPEWMALAVLYAFTAVAVAGFGVFGLHPERLPESSLAATVFANSFTFFGRFHIALTGSVLLVALWRGAGARWLASFAAVFVVSFLSEFVGTGYGIPFGAYEYTYLLGFKLGGRVPALIPLSWFVMAAPCFALAQAAFSGSRSRWKRIAFGALLLVTWDLALDPAMSFLTPYWLWADPGAFYGMPLVNLVGWGLTGVVIMGILEMTGARSWALAVSVRWWAAFYGGVLLMPLGMVMAAGLWGAWVLPLAILGGCWFAVRGTNPDPQPHSPMVEHLVSVGGRG